MKAWISLDFVLVVFLSLWKILERNMLKEKRLILSHDFCPWSTWSIDFRPKVRQKHPGGRPCEGKMTTSWQSRSKKSKKKWPEEDTPIINTSEETYSFSKAPIPTFYHFQRMLPYHKTIKGIYSYVWDYVFNTWTFWRGNFLYKA
jgi:hypothetical protein